MWWAVHAGTSCSGVVTEPGLIDLVRMFLTHLHKMLTGFSTIGVLSNYVIIHGVNTCVIGKPYRDITHWLLDKGMPGNLTGSISHWLAVLGGGDRRDTKNL